MTTGGVVFRREAGVLTGTVVGRVTLGKFLAIRAAQCDEWKVGLPLGTVMDFRGASFDLTPGGWRSAFDAGVRWTYTFNHPTALVVEDDDLEFFMAEAAEFARHGIIQAAFTSLPEACAWAAARRESLWKERRQSPQHPGPAASCLQLTSKVRRLAASSLGLASDQA